MPFTISNRYLLHFLYISLIGVLLASCIPVLDLDNQIAIPTETASATVPPPVPTETPAPVITISENDPILVGAGDIADCSGRGDEETSALLDTIPGTVFTTGDNAYPRGTFENFIDCYDPSWGRHKARTYPAPGNHDYYTEGAAAYYSYFGPNAGDPLKGYYSYNLGTWHVIVLNSELPVGAGSEQEQWLRADLTANPVDCTLAYWHTPRFSSGDVHGSSERMEPLWQALYDFGADVVLTGHEHNYERFAPQTPQGIADPDRGIREFVVGTGGYSHYPITNPLPNSEVHITDTYGVLKLVLHTGGYSWEFVPVEGEAYYDSGTSLCVTSQSTAATDTLTFTPSADATVKSESPDKNYGLENELEVDNVPFDNFLLKFDVSGINNRQVLSAKLRLFNRNESNVGGEFYYVNENNWDENSVTWNTAPVETPILISSLGAVNTDSWYEVNLSSLIMQDGTYTIRVSTPSGNGANYVSKEGEAELVPQLVINVVRTSPP